jgi:hypothetical protein
METKQIQYILLRNPGYYVRVSCLPQHNQLSQSENRISILTPNQTSSDSRNNDRKSEAMLLA